MLASIREVSDMVAEWQEIIDGGMARLASIRREESVKSEQGTVYSPCFTDQLILFTFQ